MPLHHAIVKNPALNDAATLEIPPLGRFYDGLPAWTHCVLSDAENGIVFFDKHKALEVGKLIQFNHPNLTRFLVFDVDEPYIYRDNNGEEIELDEDQKKANTCSLNWYFAGLPPPQIIIKNTLNGHCHYIYELEKPVSMSAKSKPKIIHYLSQIRRQMTLLLNADSAYVHRICKNPFNTKNQEVMYSLAKPYSLDELAKPLDLSTPRRLRNPDDYKGLGRNNDTFHEVRFFAYAYKQNCNSQDELYDAVLAEVKAFNASEYESEGMLINELENIARSISSWTWMNYTGSKGLTSKKLSLLQAKKGAKGGKKSATKNGSRTYYQSDRTRYKRKKAADLFSQGISQAEIARRLKVHKSTISRWLK